MASIRHQFATFLVSLLGFAASASASTVYNWANDWSSTDNPNGPWSYLRGSTLLPYQASTCCGIPQTTSFAPSAVYGSFLPIFYRPGGAGSDVFVHTYDPTNGGAYYGEATLAWTAPQSGVIDVSGYFYYAQNAYARSDDILVRLKSALLGSGTVSWLSHANPNDPWKFSFDQLAVNQGDVLSFTFQRSAGFFPGSILGGNVLITAVPEPSEVLMLTIGLGLLWLFRNRLVPSRLALSAGFSPRSPT